MDCRDLAEFLALYLDDELDAAQRAEFEAHLEICPSCIDYIDSYKTTMRLCKESLCDRPALPGIPEELVRAILAARRKGEPSG